MRRSLRPLFKELNRQFWAGTLPAYRVRRRVLPSSKCDRRHRTIWIASELTDPARVRATLLHEMIHIREPQGENHGPYFRGELRRLIELGETWAEEQWNSYGDPRSLIDATKVGTFRDFMYDWIVEDPKARAMSWRESRRMVARYHALTVPELYRRYPQGRRVWARLQAEVREDLAWASSEGRGRVTPYLSAKDSAHRPTPPTTGRPRGAWGGEEREPGKKLDTP